ncbi:MAG: type II toxin-antitoxin system YoeB family toxin [Pseudomonadota bacterium]
MQGRPGVGVGKPEPLKYALSGYWSRRSRARANRLHA